MKQTIISGIQQIGIGVPDVEKAFKWYRRYFGADIPAFDDEGEAGLMLPYTGGQPQKRRALLALNLQGGSGFEIWQYTDRTPRGPAYTIQAGDYGIFAAKIKARDVEKAFTFFRSSGADVSGDILQDPAGDRHFFLNDPFGNIFQVVGSESWFARSKHHTGGACGCIIGVSDINASLELYRDILGYDTIVYDKTEVFDDMAGLPGGGEEMRRVLLAHTHPRQGSFSKLIGPTRIELLQCLHRQPRKVFEGRYWGDLGFIHLCFDIHGMENLRNQCLDAGTPFTVDSSSSFDMGDAAGHFSYIEDADGTLIEFVETHRLPIIKKLGLYLDLRKRDPRKPLPGWMLRTLAFNRVKD